MKSKRKVAIFDIDGTIFRSSLLIELVDALIQEGIFPKAAQKEFERSFTRWLDRKGSYDAYIMDVVAVSEKYIKGVPYKIFAEIAEKVVAFHYNRTYVYTRDLIKKLKRRGYFLLAISLSPKTILDHFCKKLGFNKVYGKMFELGPTDQFTGRVIDEHIVLNKATIVKRAVEKENLTLEDSYGVGDSESDIPMLETVDHPICFNPNSKLYRYAKINGWKVVVERKDMIYELDPKRGKILA